MWRSPILALSLLAVGACTATDDLDAEEDPYAEWAASDLGNGIEMHDGDGLRWGVWIRDSPGSPTYYLVMVKLNNPDEQCPSEDEALQFAIDAGYFEPDYESVGTTCMSPPTIRVIDSSELPEDGTFPGLWADEES